MIKKFIKGKVYVFIDVANIFYSQKTLKWKISYERLMDYFKKECNLGKCFVYTAFDEKNEGQRRFIKMLKKSGFVVRTKPVKRIRIAKGVYEWKGNFDVELTMDVVDVLDELDTMILLSGDSDFAPLLERVKEREKRVIVMSSKRHVSKELLDIAKYINLKKLKNEIELKK
jgi:uncharacterized LabA/DUF88 family protein